jgi:predicted lipoprotein
MLDHLTHSFIVPAYDHYAETTVGLLESATHFNTTKDAANLQDLRTSLHEAYKAWQWVSFLEVGPAETQSLRFRTNTYPADTSSIITTARNFDGSNAPNFLLPSTFDQQGLPALDYLIHVFELSDFIAEPQLAQYTLTLVEELHNTAQLVAFEWNETATDFALDAGTSAASPTNKLANDFVFHVEKELRAGKVGIPAGVFSSVAFPGKVEAVYGGYSKTLFLESLKAHQMFFEGTAFDSLSVGPSFARYLDHLDIKDGTTLLSDRISEAFDTARAAAQPLFEDFKTQSATSPLQMLQLFDELQRIVVLMKVDMMQAMNIKVDYVDADGD